MKLMELVALVEKMRAAQRRNNPAFRTFLTPAEAEVTTACEKQVDDAIARLTTPPPEGDV